MEIASITATKLLFAQWEMDVIGSYDDRFNQLIEKYSNLVYSYSTLDDLLAQQDSLDELWTMIVGEYGNNTVNCG